MTRPMIEPGWPRREPRHPQCHRWLAPPGRVGYRDGRNARFNQNRPSDVLISYRFGILILDDPSRSGPGNVLGRDAKARFGRSDRRRAG